MAPSNIEQALEEVVRQLPQAAWDRVIAVAALETLRRWCDDADVRLTELLRVGTSADDAVREWLDRVRATRDVALTLQQSMLDSTAGVVH